MSVTTAFLLITLFCHVHTSILDVFRNIGIEYESFGEGRLIPERTHCKPYSIDIGAVVDRLNTNEMSEYGRRLLKNRIDTSFASICKKFNVSLADNDEDEELEESEEDERLQMRFMDRFELAWHSLKFERDLKTLFLENKINGPFLDSVQKETIRMSGASDLLEFSHRSTVFPKMCNVEKMVIESTLCFNISDVPQSGTVYALIHAGEFLHNEDVYAYYQIPEYVLITPQSLIPIDLPKCKVLFGTYIYCFEELETQCDVRSLANCEAVGLKSSGDDEFVHLRAFGTARLYATTEHDVDLLGNGTRSQVPCRIFTARVVTQSDEPRVLMKPHMDVQTSQFPPLLPETIRVLSDVPTRLYITQKRSSKVLSHLPYDQGAWDAVRSFFDRFI